MHPSQIRRPGPGPLGLTLGAALLLANAGAAAANQVHDAAGDLRAPFDNSDARSQASFDLTSAAVRAEVIGGRDRPQTVGDFVLTMTLNGQIPQRHAADYIWVINRDLGPGAQHALFSGANDPIRSSATPTSWRRRTAPCAMSMSRA